MYLLFRFVVIELPGNNENDRICNRGNGFFFKAWNKIVIIGVFYFVYVKRIIYTEMMNNLGTSPRVHRALHAGTILISITGTMPL